MRVGTTVDTPIWTHDRTQVQKRCPCRGDCHLIETKAPTNLLDTLYSRICLVTHTACELWLLFGVFTEGCSLRPWSPCPSSSLLSVHPGDSALSIFFISSCILHWAGLGILHLRSQETLLSITAPSLMARSRIRAMLSSSLQ